MIDVGCWTSWHSRTEMHVLSAVMRYRMTSWDKRNADRFLTPNETWLGTERMMIFQCDDHVVGDSHVVR
jgi:hypothetical protein